MKTFQELEYQRPSMEEVSQSLKKLQDLFKTSDNAEQQLICFQRIDMIKGHFSTMSNLAYIRHSIDTKDPFYNEEIDFFNENTPHFEALMDECNQMLLKSPYRDQLTEKLGQHFFKLLEAKAKTFSPEIIEDLVAENKLCSQYDRLIAAAEVDFESKKYTLAQLTPFRQSTDRQRRKAASEAYYGYYRDHGDEIDDIYDQLVHLRTKMAKKLGFSNFIEMAYLRLLRTDYKAEDVARYRDQVFTELVPLVTELKERQRERLGLSDFKYYDDSLQFQTGNAGPQGEADWILDQAKTMYRELSPETDEFFSFMTDYDLMDLLAKPGKEAGGYCTELPDFKAPFIFANFNGTKGDVEVMTHEAGHAFQFYQSRDILPSDCQNPTYDAAEIHSMSMEFLTWPWMERFFGQETDKFKFSHLAGAVEFIPYGTAVDEFQHWVYANPEARPDERYTQWRKIEQKYQPYLDFDGFDYLEAGGKWTRQLHIFGLPFYYIDYCLAQVCAFQFWIKDREDHASAWEAYLKLCRLGGSRPFTELVQAAGLKNPFEPGTLAEIAGQVKAYLDSVDDRDF